MKAGFLLDLSIFLPLIVSAQTRSVPEFQIIKITKNLISTPQFAYPGAAGASYDEWSGRTPRFRSLAFPR